MTAIGDLFPRSSWVVLLAIGVKRLTALGTAKRQGIPPLVGPNQHLPCFNTACILWREPRALAAIVISWHASRIEFLRYDPQT